MTSKPLWCADPRTQFACGIAGLRVGEQLRTVAFDPSGLRMQQAENREVSQHGGPFVDPVPGTGRIDIEQPAHASAVDEDLALVEVAVNGHRRMIAGLCDRKAAEQFVESSSFVREAAGDHVTVMRCATEVATAHLALGQLRRQPIEESLEVTGRGQRDRRPGECAAQGGAVQSLQDQDAVGRESVAVRNRQVSREQPMLGVQRLDPVWPNDFEADPPVRTTGFDHGSSAGSIRPYGQPYLATAHAQVAE